MKDYILAIEIGGTKLQMALGFPDGSILYNYRKLARPEMGHEGVLETVLGSLPHLQQKAREMGGRILCGGIGFGGPVDTAAGVPVGSKQVQGWDGFPLAERISQSVGVPVSLFNDSNAATWGEYCNGCGKGSKIFFYTNVGSGIGGGVVIDGKLYDGQGYGAAEFGQTYMYDPWGSAPWPVDTVENICSGWAMEKRLRNLPIPKSSLLWELCGGKQKELTCAMLGEAVRRGDSFADGELDTMCRVFSAGLAGVISQYNPERVAIGGGFSLLGDMFIGRLRKYTAQMVFMSSVGRYEILKCKLDEDIVLVGVLRLLSETGPGRVNIV